MKPIACLAFVVSLGLAGCADLTASQLIQLGAQLANGGLPSDLPGSVDRTAPDYPRLPPETGPTTDRATTDLPDDSPLKQAHIVYFLPSDAPDQQLDTNGGISGMLAVAAKWMRDQADGRTLRVDMVQGKPDITFFRSPKTTAQIGATASEIRAEIASELVAAGFDNPNKTYCSLYAGSSDSRADRSTTGLSKGKHSAVFFNQCNPCTGSVYRRGMSFKTSLTFLHETFHSIGYGHVTDDENDIMSASGESLWLDRGHDTYFKAYRPGQPDLADSLFLDPLPAGVTGS